MSEYLPILGTLLGVAVGGVIGFGSTYFVQRQRFKKEDEDKLHEKVYGAVYPILVEAARRYEPSGLKPKYPGIFLLKTKEVVQIDAIFGTYYRLIPMSILNAWVEALDKGPPTVGLREDERLTFSLEKMFEEIKREVLRARRK